MGINPSCSPYASDFDPSIAPLKGYEFYVAPGALIRTFGSLPTEIESNEIRVIVKLFSWLDHSTLFLRVGANGVVSRTRPDCGVRYFPSTFQIAAFLPDW